MIKILTTLLLLINIAFAKTPLENTIEGKWHSITRSVNNGTQTVEKEYLNLYNNNKFNLVLLVSLEKGDFFVKDLRIEVSGIWRAKYKSLIYIIEKINVPVAKEVYRINQQSLRNLANNFKRMYETNKIHINKINYLNSDKMTIVNEKGSEVSYSRSKSVPQRPF